MQLMINIDEGTYNKICDQFDGKHDVLGINRQALYEAIKSGTVLPEGHGALMDKNAYMKSLEDRVQDLNNKDTLKNHDKIHGISMAYNICTRVPAIIQAEREEKE